MVCWYSSTVAEFPLMVLAYVAGACMGHYVGKWIFGRARRRRGLA